MRLHRSVTAFATLALSLALVGCSIGEGAATREGDHLIASSANQPSVAVTRENLLGTWERTGPVKNGTPTRIVLSFEDSDTGSAWTYLDFDGPGLSPPSPFSYQVEDTQATLDFGEQRIEHFSIVELKRSVMVMSLEGTATFAATGNWVRARD